MISHDDFTFISKFDNANAEQRQILLTDQQGKNQVGLALSQTKTLDTSKLKEFADDNKMTECSSNEQKTQWERRNCLLRAICPFTTVFSKALYCRQGFFGKGLI